MENVADTAETIPEKAVQTAAVAGLRLVQTDEGLTLTDGILSLCADFRHLVRRLRADNLRRELVVRAAKIKLSPLPLRILDATAGLGEDSFLLAAAGHEVRLYEYDPVIAALLRDALRRAGDIPELADAAARMHLTEGDSITAMHALTAPPDVILLDPMFPEREKSALIKKKFQLLQRLEKPCGNEQELLDAAIAAHPRRIVIKRPLKAPCLAGRRPDYALKGSTIRYDCIILGR